jgi:hypothetical protein
MKTIFTVLAFVFKIIFITNAQISLSPSIGLSHLPNDNDAICDIPLYITDNYDTGGYAIGDTIAHFKLYTLVGDSIDIGTELEKGMPIVLISGNYTCPVFRNDINEINLLSSQYLNKVQFYIVYTIEAHPDGDTSPYFGFVNTTTLNYSENILYHQPTTYGERKQVAKDMINDLPINVPIIIDGPCNHWWETFGPGPTKSYLITTKGTVFTKHGWFNQAPNNMSNDIDSLLATSKMENNPASNFKFNIFFSSEKNEIIISISTNIQSYKIELFDISGKLIKKESVENNNGAYNLHLNNIKKQILFYRISDEGNNNIMNIGKIIN